MRKLTNYEKHLREELRDPEFRKAFKRERARVEVAYTIAQLRKKSRISQRELAEKLGTTQSVVARMETGQQNFTLETLQKIADAFRKRLKVELV